MSALDPSPSSNKITISSEEAQLEPEEQHLGKTLSKIPTPFTEQAKSQVKDTALATLSPLLVIVRITIIFIFALLADTLILMIINWSFGSIVSRSRFGAKLLEGIQILSALGTAVAYILYLIRSLLKDARHVLEEIRVESSRKEVSP